MKRFATDLYLRFTLGTVFIVGIVILMVFGYMTRQERQALAVRLSEKAAFINSFYSFLVADALLRNDDVTLQQVINKLEEDQEITSVVVVDQKGEVRYHVDPQKVGEAWKDDLITQALQKSDGVVTAFKNAGGDALALVSPLKVKGRAQPIGAVRIEMTYRHIDKQIQNSFASFPLIVMGAVGTCVGLMLYWVRGWVFRPMQTLQRGLLSMKPSMLEASFPETNDEFGRIHKALNDLIVRIKTDYQNQEMNSLNQAAQERALLEQLVRALAPEAIVLLADKDNRSLSDGQHLLDLITDANFATLVGTAFQREGEARRGPVVFQEKPYEAVVFRLPLDLSKNVRTLIALREEHRPSSPAAASGGTIDAG